MKGTKSVISDENKRLCVWLKRQRQDKGHTMRSLSEVRLALLIPLLVRLKIRSVGWMWWNSLDTAKH
ncbi:hypothetical protein ALON55S_01593 [Alishewanella longhuensis]